MRYSNNNVNISLKLIREEDKGKVSAEFGCELGFDVQEFSFTKYRNHPTEREFLDPRYSLDNPFHVLHVAKISLDTLNIWFGN